MFHSGICWIHGRRSHLQQQLCTRRWILPAAIKGLHWSSYKRYDPWVNAWDTRLKDTARGDYAFCGGDGIDEVRLGPESYEAGDSGEYEQERRALEHSALETFRKRVNPERV